MRRDTASRIVHNLINLIKYKYKYKYLQIRTTETRKSSHCNLTQGFQVVWRIAIMGGSSNLDVMLVSLLHTQSQLPNGFVNFESLDPDHIHSAKLRPTQYSDFFSHGS